MPNTHFFATAAKGTEPIVAKELECLHAQNIRATTGGVHFEGSMETLYRANLWLRTANRLLMPIAEFPCPTPQALYEHVRQIRWNDWMTLRQTLAVDCNCRDSRITHSRYAALKIKDAIVDQFRARTSRRPNVDLRRPDFRINAHITKDRCVLSLDASGDRLHLRSYRRQATEAPLRETLAATIVELVGWDNEGMFIDPMCGSGTIIIEAALKAINYAPGLLRCGDASSRESSFGFQRWPGFDRKLWGRLIAEARDSIREKIPGRLLGYDISREAIQIASQNAKMAGLEKRIRFERGNVLNLYPRGNRGVIVCNLPYGERTGELEELKSLYKSFGDVLKQRCTGYTAYLFTGNLKLAKFIGLRTARRFTLYNGPIECRLLKYELF
ncbi:MAG: THUMP domain-containing protein [Candidatus Poribacteria bacterium]|nr:THUMP domain-containing protein [Candidatus Poribacteria bacterium]